MKTYHIGSPMLLSVVILCGCESDPNSGGPPVQQVGTVKPTSGLAPAPQPGSIADYRKKNLQKTDPPTSNETPKPSTSSPK